MAVGRCSVCREEFDCQGAWRVHSLEVHGFTAEYLTKTADQKTFAELLSLGDAQLMHAAYIALEELMPQDELEKFLCERAERGWNNNGGGNR